MMRDQLTEFCGSGSHKQRKRMCFPDKGVDGITAARDNVMTGSDH